MCSNNCECDPVVVPGPNLIDVTEKRCRKCGCEPFIIMDKVHIECKQCFLESCNKKLRSTIGKSKLVKNNDDILIAYSGGPSSCVLLDLIWNSVQSQARREQKFKPSILHIDMQSLPSENLPNLLDFERRSNLDNLLKYLNKTYPGWPIYWSTLEASYTDDRPLFSSYDSEVGVDDKHYLLNNLDAKLCLHKSLQDIPDLTDKQQFLSDRTGEFINQLASSINNSMFELAKGPIQYVFTASSATQLANNLLVDVILGRGATICSTVNVCDRRARVPVLRALRDFSKKEVAFYLRARNLEAKMEANSLLTLQPVKSSVQTMTENFLSKLYVDYPSTYSTLLRTGNKMQDKAS